jgi:perosamine synthetase
MNYIPVYQPNLRGNEKKYLEDCIDSGWISSRGKYIEEFEKKFSSFIGAKYATTCSNGTTALHLALIALGIKPGDNILVPNFTYVASFNCIKYMQANPVFVDVNTDDWTIDIDHLKIIIKQVDIKAVIFVNMYGFSGKIKEITEICKERDIYVVEDAAEGLGSKLNNDYFGTFGDIATFSFFGNKTMTTGEGGMVCSNSFDLIEAVRSYKSHCVSRFEEYEHEGIGYNYRMTNMSAAIGCAQLERVESFLELKRNIAEFYIKKLDGCDFKYQKQQQHEISSYWMFSIQLNTEEKRDLLREHLKLKGIETRRAFRQATKMKPYLSNVKYQNAEIIANTALNLPSFPDLKIEELTYICDSINEFYEFHK